jgi:hypothetical protein
MSYDIRLRNKNYCAYKCLFVQSLPSQTDIPAIDQSPALKQIKLQKGGTPQFRQFQINQFGRIAGTGGQPPNNFR